MINCLMGEKVSHYKPKITLFRSTKHLGPVPRKMVNSNPGLSQSSAVFSFKNIQLEVTKYRSAFTIRHRNDNTKCYPKQRIGI